MTTLKKLGEQLRTARATKKVYKTALAHRTGVNRNTLHSLETGTGNVSLNTLLAVSDELGLDIVLVPKEVSAKVGSSSTSSVRHSAASGSFITRAIASRTGVR